MVDIRTDVGIQTIRPGGPGGCVPGISRRMRGEQMDQRERSPHIGEISWGHIEAGDLVAVKDAKLYPGGGREWDWAETGTRHVPGIQPADVEELLEHGATAVVLSRGMGMRLRVSPAALAYLEQRSIAVHVAETREAVEIYNKLADEIPVGGLFHSTC